MLDWNKVNLWTHSLYVIVHSLSIAEKIQFGDLQTLDENFRNSNQWVLPACSYNSVLISHQSHGKKLIFRRDPNKHFKETSAHLINILLQDLVVILDEMLTQVLIDRNWTAGIFPKSKLEKLRTILDPKFEWSYNGCLEMIAARNVITHNNGKWNKKSIDHVSGFVSPCPKAGDDLVIGISMLFNYRKAMRTFLNEVKLP